MIDPGVEKTVSIPEEVDVSLEGGTFNVSGPNGELSREFDLKDVEIGLRDNEAIVKSDSSKKRTRAAVGTAVSHIKNMIQGVKEDFSSKLKVVYSHFPISVSVQDGKVQIDNFIGEEEPRFADIVGDAEVEVKGEEIEVRGANKEDVGQTAANIEQTAHVRGRDPRVFQDGIYIVERP